MNDNDSSTNLTTWICQMLDKKGGLNIMAIDVRDRSSITDFIVIATGTSSRHIETLVEAPCQEMKKNGFPATAIEGNGTHWVVADFGDVMVHIFDEQARRYFDLENLWHAAPRHEWNTSKQSPLKVLSL